MKVPRINCKQVDGYGFCNKKKRGFWGKPYCPEMEMKTCEIAERYPAPTPPSPPP